MRDFKDFNHKYDKLIGRSYYNSETGISGIIRDIIPHPVGKPYYYFVYISNIGQPIILDYKELDSLITKRITLVNIR